MDSILDTQPSLSKQSLDPPRDSSSKGEHDVTEKELEPVSYFDVTLQNERDLVTHVLSVDDDTSLNPYTFRVFFLGVGLSALGGALAEIYFFKPQSNIVNTMFLVVITYFLGMLMELAIPRSGWFRYLNPGPFNKKESTFIVIMASAASNAAMATEVLAVQGAFYNIVPPKLATMFIVTGSQYLGYCIAGLMRPILLYPSKMLYPTALPIVSVLGTLHAGQAESNKKRLNLLHTAFFSIFIWELFPEWIFPLLTGFSIFCLASPASADFTRMFGGSNFNEGLGFLSLCFNWRYISAISNPFVIPLRAQVSVLIGYIFSVMVLGAVYGNNMWLSKNFPFLSQNLFYENGTIYNQRLILNHKYEVDSSLVAQHGLPYYAGTWVATLLFINMGLAATFTHLLLWNRDDLRSAWSWMSISSLRETDWRFWRDDGTQKVPADVDIDPHYREMLKYREIPTNWYAGLLVQIFVLVAVFLHKGDTMLPWWGLAFSLLLAAAFILCFGALYAMTGIMFDTTPLFQVIGGMFLPGKPIANMYFTLYGASSVSQGERLLTNLKLAQYVKLSPRAACFAQFFGTFIGTNLNSVLAKSILLEQGHTLVSVNGTDIWSGRRMQQFNWQSLVFGGLHHELFAPGKRYQIVLWGTIIGFLVPIPFWLVHRYHPRLRTDYLYTPIVLWSMGLLGAGINSPYTVYFVVALTSQWFLRTCYPKWFVKYNYLLGGALDGGTGVVVFILSFVVQGGTGKSHLFPKWWGASRDGNYDRCAVTTSSS